MQSLQNFDDIRPYRNDEFKEVVTRLVNDPVFYRVLSKMHDSEEKIQGIKMAMLGCKSIEDFQANIVVPMINTIIVSSCSGVTMEGLERLDKKQRYLFISNHRDIILDSALMNVKMHENGYNPTEIAIGSNLLIFQWINDLVRINRSFIVNRNIPVKEMLTSSKKLSTYIRQMITNGSDSVWIAQREGRAKDGNDQTAPALLKMLNMSNCGSFFDGFNDLKIVPMAISYEIEPCGNEKVAELKKREADPNFQKTEKDDLMSMASGLKNQKGQVHIQFGRPIDEKVLHRISDTKGMNERLKELAEYIDSEIYTNYKLFANNYIAYDLYFKTSKYSDKYSSEEKNGFIELTHKRLQLINEDFDESMELWLKMYATPVSNFEKIA